MPDLNPISSLLEQLRGMSDDERARLMEQATLLPAPAAPARLCRPACGARCRDGHACVAPVVAGKRRCVIHGGRSTGPRTEAGRAAIAESNRRRADARKKVKYPT